MFKGLFKSSSQGSRPSGGSRSSHRRSKSNSHNEVSNQRERDEEAHLGIIKRTADEESFASGMPSETPALHNKMESHRAGTLFKYAVITNKPSDERKSLLDKLRSYKPQSTLTVLTLNDIAPVRMIGDAVNMSLSSIVSPEIMDNRDEYLVIDCILVHFVPLDSFVNDKSVVTIQVNDFRKTSSTVARQAKVDNTMGYNILFFLDYFIEKRDAGKMSLSFTCSTKEFQPGTAWGAVKVVAQLQTRSFPARLPLMGTLGVLLLSDTDLEEFECDPRSIDLVVTPEALFQLRNLRLRGEIENKTIPLDDKKGLNTAKTIMGDSYEDDDVASVIDNLKNVALNKERTAAAKKKNQDRLKEIAEEEGQSMQRPSSARPMSPYVEDLPSDDETNRFRSLKSPNHSESASQVGESVSQVNRDIDDNQLTRRPRFVD